MRIKSLLIGLAFIVFVGASHATEPPKRTEILLWPKGAPQAQGSEVTDQPAITVHLPPEGKANGAAVIVNPGGGYRILAADHEGLQVAKWLNRVGVTAFVLRYRVKPNYDSKVSLLDAQRAIRYVRSHAADYKISPKRIGMLGFSAGGHLTTAAGTTFDSGDPKAADPIDSASCRPDFIVPVYPAVDGTLFNRDLSDEYYPTEKRVTPKTPPAFIVQTNEDTTVIPTHPILFYEALLKAKVPAEFHIFGFGAHGLGLAPGDPDLNEWPNLLARWMRRSGFFTDAERIPIEGTVTIDGESLAMGWVTLIPENENSPIARASVGKNPEGKFVIDREHGPVAGRHRVEVYLTSRISPLNNKGEYSLDDAERYTKLNPGEKSPLVLDIKPGEKLTLAIKTK